MAKDLKRKWRRTVADWLATGDAYFPERQQLIAVLDRVCPPGNAELELESALLAYTSPNTAAWKDTRRPLMRLAKAADHAEAAVEHLAEIAQLKAAYERRFGEPFDEANTARR